MSPSSYVRAAGIASVLGATFVLLGIGIAGVVTPDYSAIRDVISGSQLGPYGSLVTLGLTGGGSLTVVFASLLQRTLPPGNVIGPGLLVVRGFGTLLAAAFLAEKKKPSEAEIKQALEGLKCRCGTHVSILKAVKRAATMMG